MRKIAVIILLFIYLFSSTELSELLKINILVEHYAEHQLESKEISFSDFFYMHYIDQSTENEDDQHDSQLPFHSHSHSESDDVNFVVPVVVPNSNYSLSFENHFVIELKKVFYQVNSSLTPSFLSSIWQPPQIV